MTTTTVINVKNLWKVPSIDRVTKECPQINMKAAGIVQTPNKNLKLDQNNDTNIYRNTNRTLICSHPLIVIDKFGRKHKILTRQQTPFAETSKTKLTHRQTTNKHYFRKTKQSILEEDDDNEYSDGGDDLGNSDEGSGALSGSESSRKNIKNEDDSGEDDDAQCEKGPKYEILSLFCRNLVSLQHFRLKLRAGRQILKFRFLTDNVTSLTSTGAGAAVFCEYDQGFGRFFTMCDGSSSDDADTQDGDTQDEIAMIIEDILGEGDEDEDDMIAEDDGGDDDEDEDADAEAAEADVKAEAERNQTDLADEEKLYKMVL